MPTGILIHRCRYHNFGDVTFRVGSPPPPPGSAAGTLDSHSIHCSDGTASCIEGAPRHAATSQACGEACATTPLCACWSYAVHTGTCYLLSNGTDLPIADTAASCGWKASWSQAAAAAHLRMPSSFSSASAGVTPPTVLPTPAGEILAADLTPTIPGSPLNVRRHYSSDPDRGDLLIRYELSNPGKAAIELSSFGVSMIFNQFFTGRSLDQVATQCSFTEPSIALQAGYVSVVSTTGTGPVLLVLPEQAQSSSISPASSLMAAQHGFEGWRMITEDPTPRGVTFEGFYELMAHTKAWAKNEWAEVTGEPWNPATSRWINPESSSGDNTTGSVPNSASFAYRLTLAPSLQEVGKTLLELGRPVVSAIPGYTLSMPSMSGSNLVAVRRRCVKYSNGGERCVLPSNVTMSAPDFTGTGGEPLLQLCVTARSAAVSACPVCPASLLSPVAAASVDSNDSDIVVELRLIAAYPAANVAQQDAQSLPFQGRVRVVVEYEDGMSQVIQLYVQPDAPGLIQTYTDTLRTKQFYDNPADPFHRTAALLNWNRDADSGNGGQILQESRAWIAGLSDECGAGPAVALASKNLWAPRQDELALLERYVDEVLWGKDDAQRLSNHTVQSSSYGVRASMFFSGLAGFKYTVNPCWDEARSLTTWRSYNYPHVTIVYWSLYRVARNYGNASVLTKGWQWYLGQAVNTTLLGVARHGQYNGEGLMAGSVWRLLLHDLKREGSESNDDATKMWLAAAEQIETFMRGRAEDWAKQQFPFGSEMPWDRCVLGRADEDAIDTFHAGGHQYLCFHCSLIFRCCGASTGQEEVFGWSREFGLYSQSNATVDAVLAYTPRLPSWAYHGNSRRYFDFLVYGSPDADTGTEREFHHYGAPLNALVTLEAWRVAPVAPNSLYLLEVGVGGMSSFLTNVNATDGALICLIFLSFRFIH